MGVMGECIGVRIWAVLTVALASDSELLVQLDDESRPGDSRKEESPTEAGAGGSTAMMLTDMAGACGLRTRVGVGVGVGAASSSGASGSGAPVAGLDDDDDDDSTLGGHSLLPLH